MNINKEKKEKIKKISVLAVIVITIVVVLILLTNTQEIQIEDGNHYTAKEIEECLISSKLDKNAVYLYLKSRYKKQPDIPFVEYVDVELIGINKLKFTVYEKNVVGCIEYMNKYIYFDKDGYFVEQSDEKLEDVSFVTGLKFNSITLYEKMSIENDSFFDTIMDLTKLIDKYEIKIDKIKFNGAGSITLYSDEIEILLGKHDTYDEQIAKLVGLLESAKGMAGIFHMENYDGSDDNIIFNKK